MDMNNLPNYIVNIDDEQCGMTGISLVECPAIEMNFITLSEEKQLLQFADEEKRDVFGPAILANVPIYRRRGTYEYTITFTADTIRRIVERFASNNLQNVVNLQHDDSKFINSAIMIEYFIKDSAAGINPVQFQDVPEGSLFVKYHITDEALWNEIKSSGKLNGFSIEIYCDLDKDRSDDTKSALDAFVSDLLS